ncbi:MAG: NUDIX hydrolase [Prolixibacteraceae bacterium]|jgi:8-oxo-dGTP diphosphatase|nr:NUDIX hydrolase [Prolixibacteraceae bacterium]MBT6006302.1 NUDIX hydrolase [Prolixibacteraceae bacterium]MBT6765125.1 NUDIX hydrolase [Prolixibacteraceae bacterium]MBT6999593.1 NUDIX hydrolase [Prolixibacteraceae bacterium]MBT7396884.1 NUDIX hydrolase [Prolixibacteraceae bacterium]
MYTYQYPRAALTTDAIVFVKDENETSVLLIKRGREPFKNKWALPGGFINLDETLETACKRELLEETGLVVEKMTQFKTYDALNRDPRHRTLSVVFYVEILEKENVKGSDDAVQADWFAINNLPELAFDHQQILEDFFDFINL